MGRDLHQIAAMSVAVFVAVVGRGDKVGDTSGPRGARAPQMAARAACMGAQPLRADSEEKAYRVLSLP